MQRSSGLFSMLRNLTINARVTIGFAVVLAFLILSGSASYVGIKSAVPDLK